MKEASKDTKIDENLYSRQIFVLGIDAMKKLASSSVLISGMGGLGVEIAKNVILAGVQSVTIHDTRNATINDLASNFYLTEKSIGKNRAVESLAQLANLNEYVTVDVKTEQLTNDFIKNYNCVVITDFHPESEIKRISAFCHQNDIKLIITETRGLFAYVFTDFGPNFVVTDPNGKPPSRFFLDFITQDERALVSLEEDEEHELGDGDHVTFDEVEGMTEINGKEFEVKIKDKNHFYIGDTRSFGRYKSEKRCGVGIQVIVPKKYNFLEYTEALKNPSTRRSTFDYCVFGQDSQVVLAFVAAQHYLDKSHKDTPEVSGDDLLESAKEVNSTYKIVDEIDEQLIREFARESGAVICPSCATFGGIAGQEVIKSLSGKFGPVFQFVAMGYTSSLPKNPQYELKHDRYDPYRIVFGNKQQEAMENLRYFMIGAGAIGCEQLKNFALMGVATKNNGKIFVTDMDSIEKSNLNRQFLFRNKDIGKMKSDIAAEAVRVMNPNIQIESQQNRLGQESRSIYNDDFYENLDGVCNALDNIPTRVFSNKMCVFYDKPLLESGTLGAKSNFQIVVPHITKDYGNPTDTNEKSFAICTVHNTPSTIVECCAWGKNQFVGLFENDPQSILALLRDPNYIENMKVNDENQLKNTLMAIKQFYIVDECNNFNDCIQWARYRFEEYFNEKIRILIANHPEDQITDQGLRYWSGKRRFPRPATFDPNNHLHAQFVKSAATLRARVCGIKPENVDIPQIAAQIQIPENHRFAPTQSMALININDLIQEVTPFIEKVRERPPTPEKFEKDDDSNGHIDFIGSTTNIRATNFYIDTVSDLEIKRIAGSIIPAIATTTAMICGIVALEMYKVHCVDGDKKISDFRFGAINLAVPSFFIAEPMPCDYTECSENKTKFTLWDKWVIEGDLTIGEFIKAAKEKYNITVSDILLGKFKVYPVFNEKLNQEKLNTKILDIAKECGIPALSEGQHYFPVTCFCYDEEYNDVETPPFYMKVK